MTVRMSDGAGKQQLVCKRLPATSMSIRDNAAMTAGPSDSAGIRRHARCIHTHALCLTNVIVRLLSDAQEVVKINSHLGDDA